VQIQSVKKEELALLINGLRSTIVMDQQDLQARLLEQLEAELLQRFGLKLREAA
jgi:dihydroxyacetone kinase